MKKFIQQVRYFFKGNPPALLGTIIIGLFIVLSDFAPFFAPYKPTERDHIKFKVTADALKELQEKRMPEETIAKLAALQGQKFISEAALLEAVEQQIGKAESDNIGRKLVRAAPSGFEPGPMPVEARLRRAPQGARLSRPGRRPCPPTPGPSARRGGGRRAPPPGRES